MFVSVVLNLAKILGARTVFLSLSAIVVRVVRHICAILDLAVDVRLACQRHPDQAMMIVRHAILVIIFIQSGARRMDATQDPAVDVGLAWIRSIDQAMQIVRHAMMDISGMSIEIAARRHVQPSHANLNTRERTWIQRYSRMKIAVRVN